MPRIRSKVFIFFIFAFAILWMLNACNSVYTSRPKGYFKIDFPTHQYQLFDKPGFPYSFEYPQYARVVQDSTFFDAAPENPYWVNIEFPQFGGKIFLSYKIIGGKALYKVKDAHDVYHDSTGINEFDRMVDDAFNLTNKNQVMSTSIKDSLFRTRNGVSGVFFRVGGNAATSKQFFVSDTSKNFLRGALYFDVTPNYDSLKPVQDFLQVDMDHLINSFRWK